MSSWSRVAGSTFIALSTLAACSNDGPPSATQAPTPGDLGPAGADTSFAAADPAGPRKADPQKPGDKPKPAGSSDTPMNPDAFQKKAACLLPKLSTCSEYGAGYNKLDSVAQFCNALGGESASGCLDTGRVLRCMTPADVVTSYYSTGEKPYTKESATAKCNEKNWLILDK